MYTHHLPDNTLIHPDIESYLDSDCIDVYWKDTAGHYLGVNEQFLRYVGVHSYDEVIGKTDADLIWAKHAPLVMKNDAQIVLTEQPKIFMEAGMAANVKVNNFLSCKKPLRLKSGKVIGTFGLSILVEDKNNINIALEKVSRFIDPFNLRTMPLLAPTPHNLTQRQFECLLYLVKGMTVKQIATTLELSPKTVEHYLEAVKGKLNCFSRAELIAKALQINARFFQRFHINFSFFYRNNNPRISSRSTHNIH